MTLDWRAKYDNLLEGVIQLTGGEPLIRDDWRDIADYCTDNSLNVMLMTNGTLITSEIASFLFERDIGVQVSLDGLEDTHNKIRGHNSYNDVMQGLNILLNKQVKCSVSFTLLKSNINEISTLIDEIQRIGVTRLGISRYLPKSDSDDQLLTKEELERFYNYIAKINTHGDFRIYCRDPLYNLSCANTQHLKDTCLSGCSIGFFGCCILADGTIIPCSRLNIPLGNIKQVSLREIWASSELLWKFRKFGNLKGKCKKCRYLNNCRGCRAIAYAINRDYLSEDPQCYILVE